MLLLLVTEHLLHALLLRTTLCFNFLINLVLWVDHQWLITHRNLLAMSYESTFDKANIIITYQMKEQKMFV